MRPKTSGEYMNTAESKFYDCWGRELEAQTCEYCGVTKPISHWIGIENGKDDYIFLMVEFVGFVSFSSFFIT